MKTITVQELATRLNRDERCEVVDVRTPAEYAGIHIPGARSIPLDELDCAKLLAERQATTEASGTTELYLVCHTGARAAKAAEKLAAAGVKECVIVEGGTQNWAASGLPVVKGPSKVLPLDRQLHVTIGILVLTSVFLAEVVNPVWIWLAAFVGAGLIFAGISGICAMRMLLARMPWNQVPTAAPKPGTEPATNP